MDYTLVTGASGGIGMALAKEFARNGHDLILVARRFDKLNKLKEELENAFHVKVEVFVADLSCEEERNKLYSYTANHNMEVEILVNNAGFGDSNAFLDTSWERQKNMVELNVLALMHLTHLYGSEMRNRGKGKILNLASAAAFSAGPYMPVYYASKGFVLSLSQAMHEELNGSGVTVTALCPGPTATGFEKSAGMEHAKMFHVIGVESAESVAKCGYSGVMKGRAVVYHGITTHMFNIATRLTTRKFAGRRAKKLNR